MKCAQYLRVTLSKLTDSISAASVELNALIRSPGAAKKAQRSLARFVRADAPHISHMPRVSDQECVSCRSVKSALIAFMIPLFTCGARESNPVLRHIRPYEGL